MPIPRATYRLQLRPDFDFDRAAAVADYLARLGVSHLYASPYLQAAPGSTHGYDVVDPSRVNVELGGEEGHGRLVAALRAAGLGQILDIVPNHMAVTGPENRWWWDVLRNGPASGYASFFDVDWDPPERRLRNHVLMPVLGDHYGREIEAGDILVSYDDDGFLVRYHDHVLPLSPRSIGALLLAAVDRAAGDEGADELGFLGRSLVSLPDPAVTDQEARRRRQRDVEAIDRRMATILADRAALREAVSAEVAAVNADPDRLDDILRAQSYRLAYWRAAGQELDYRRFFDIDSLAGLRTEDPEVFEAVHERVLEWLRAGDLDGVRVDHPDGLRRPAEYFGRLREAAPEAWVVAEKILMPDEPPPPWPIQGTTGYELLNDVLGVFVDGTGEAPMTRAWTDWSGDDRDFHEVAFDARHDVLRDVLAADVNRLANIFMHLCEERRRYRDFTRPELRAALVEVAASFPVYRSYVGEAGSEAERRPEPSARDREVIDRAVAGARDRRPDIDPELLELLRAVLLGEIPDDEARGLRMRFQQLTGPVAAKGEEDTAFYRYNRLVALNEVGGDPGRWGLGPDAFHERMRRRAEAQPAGMSALSTHDTKRSEDVRARLVLLAQIPAEWTTVVGEWRRRNEGHWPRDLEPDPGAEYLLYQTLVGAWPIDRERVTAYMEKATREAKLRTSWTDPDPAYDAGLADFIAGLYASGFGDEVAAFVEPLIRPGRVVSLAQKLVQLMAPGVPDIYQGSEIWDLSLVDPDNRRPVDFDARRRLLERTETSPGPETILEGMDEGLPKLWVVRQALRLRAERPDAFAGDYAPIRVTGAAADLGLGFVRGGAVAVCVPRLPLRLERGGGWLDTAFVLPPGTWRNVLTGRETTGGAVRAAELLEAFPVALLAKGAA